LANRFGSLDCGVESTIKSRFFPCGNTREQCGTTEGVLERSNQELLTGLVGMLPGGQVNTKARVRRKTDACACSGRRSMEPSERASNTTENVRDRSRFGKGSSSASFGVRRVSEQRSLYFHRARLFHRDDVDRSGRKRIAASPHLSLERELAGTERGTESPTEMPSVPRAQTEGS